MFENKYDNDERYMICPNCGGVIPANSVACPECGSDEETGWAEEACPDEKIIELNTKKPQSTLWKKIAQYGSMGITVLIVYGLIAYFIPFGVFIGFLVTGGLLTAFLSVGRFRPLSKLKEKDLEKELLSISGHDSERVERLVIYEWKKNPGATRVEMVQAAIDRLKWDRR
ncbi:MAG: hypothetical protein JW904_06730 [Spirochaetales bacterium]|nr:hypothetical protein [Spirochaetales bacterium]